jgi:hypothetical protein
MGKYKRPALTREGNTMHINDRAEVNLVRLKEVINVMLPIFHTHKQVYIDNLVFPEYVLKEFFHKPEYAKILSQFLFVTNYWDHNKDSYVHHTSDMAKVWSHMQNNSLKGLISPDVNQWLMASMGVAASEESVDYDFKKFDLINYIHSLDDERMNVFLRKIIRGPVLDLNSYRNRKAAGNESNMWQQYFEETLDIIVKNYDSDPRNIFMNLAPEQAVEQLTSFRGVGEGLAYLNVVYFAESGLVPYEVSELRIKPKIDVNDIKLLRLLNVFEIHSKINHHQLVSALSDIVQIVAIEMDVSTADVDYAFWVAAQLTRQSYIHLQDFSTGKPFFKPDDFQSLYSSYYIDGWERPNGDKMPLHKGYSDEQLNIHS